MVRTEIESLLDKEYEKILEGKAHRWALSPISVISDIGLSLISELLISD
jgi:hypothetical protein